MNSVNVHILNVGHGDCTFIEHESGRLTMIDINNSKSLPIEDEIALAEAQRVSLKEFRGRIFLPKDQMSWEDYYRSLLVDPVDYFKANFPGRSVFRYIQTHPDMDHMSGLFRFFWQERIELMNMWDTAHTKSFDEKDFLVSPYDYYDWLAYRLMRVGDLSDGRTHKVLQRSRDDVGSYWIEDGLQIWGPDQELVHDCNVAENWNDSSYMLRVEYGGRSLVLPGDAEKPAWDAVEQSLGAPAMKCDLLKAAHHGRDSGYSDSAVSAMSPDIVICSVGKKPSTDASDRYAAQGAEVLSTRYHGTIVIRMWSDGEVDVFDRNSAKIGGLPAIPQNY